MRRPGPGMIVPLLLAVVGVGLIIVSQLDLDQPAGPSLPPIAQPTATPAASPSDSPSVTATPTAEATAEPTPEPTPSPTPTPIPADWVAVQLEIPSVALNVEVRTSPGGSTDDFPPLDAAYVLASSSHPGRGTNSYIFAHAYRHLFKPLWNVQLGAEVLVLMSDGEVLRYVVTEVHPNVSCPDDRAPPHPNPPLALKYAPPGCAEGVAWTLPTDHERLTLQTSQGYNRNWGELIVIAEPVA